MDIKNLKVNEYYFHSLINDFSSSINTINGIVESGYILSPIQRGNFLRHGCNKLDEICLSKKRIINRAFEYISSFSLYISELPTLILDKSIKYECKIYQPKIITTKEIYDAEVDGSTTNIYDEYRTKDKIDINYIKGLSIPFDKIINDPYVFLKLISKHELFAYYRGEIDPYLIDGIRKGNNTPEIRNERIKILEQFIQEAKDAFKSKNIELPIYEYNDKKFTLR